MGKIDMDKLRTAMLETVLTGGDVHDLFDKVYACIRLPMIFFDVSFAVLAYAFPRPYAFEHWETMVVHGRTPEDMVTEHDYLSSQERMVSAGKSCLFNTGTSEGFAQACGPVMQDGKLIGYSGIMIEDAEIEECLEANDLLSSVISLLWNPDVKSGGAETALERSVERVLLGEGISDELAAEFIERFPPPYVFSVLTTGAAGMSTLEYARSVLCTRGSGILGCLSGSSVYLIGYAIESEKAMDDIRAALARLIKKHPLEGGVSDFFLDPRDVPKHSAQATLAMSVGRSLGERLTLFRARYCEIVEYCATEYYGRAACRLPAVTELFEQDRRAGGALLLTLEVYLREFRRHSAAATNLGLHKNTVINRIQKIGEMLGADLNDAELCEGLLMGIELHRLLGGLDSREGVR